MNLALVSFHAADVSMRRKCLLVSFEAFVLNARMIFLDPEDGLCTILGFEELCVQGTVWEKEPNDSTEDDRNSASDDFEVSFGLITRCGGLLTHKPFPRSEVASLDPQDSV